MWARCAAAALTKIDRAGAVARDKTLQLWPRHDARSTFERAAIRGRLGGAKIKARVVIEIPLRMARNAKRALLLPAVDKRIA